MAKEKEQKKEPYVAIDGVDYTEEQLDANQKLMVQHYNDLTRKIGSSTFNLQQLQFGRQAFVDALTASLKVEPKVEEEASK